MVLYLCSESLSVVKVNEKPHFSIFEQPKRLEIDTFNPPLIEIIPLGERANGLCFYADEKFFSNPPNCVILTRILGDYHLKIKRDFSALPFKVICQKKMDEAVITVFSDRGYKISVETLFDYYLQDVDYQIESAEIYDVDQNKNVFIHLSGTDNVLCGFNLNDKISLVFLKKISSFELVPNLTTTEIFPTHLKHKKRCEWEFNDGTFKVKTFTLETENKLDEQTRDKLLPYVFLEGLCMGENVQEYLCDNLVIHKQKLLDYLGDFIGVFPPPINVCPDFVGLLYKSKENVNYTTFVRVDVKDKKVANIKIIDK